MNKRTPVPKLPLDLSSSEDLKHFDQDGPTAKLIALLICKLPAILRGVGWIALAAAYVYIGKPSL